MKNALSLFILLLSSTVYGQISANDSQIKDVADPSDPQDATTKNYVDTNITNVKNSPWFVNQVQDSIAFEKKVVIGSIDNDNLPPLTVIGTDSGSYSPTIALIRSMERNNVIQFETSEADNNYRGSLGIIETFDSNNGGSIPNFFAIGVNNGLVWKNPLRIYYDNSSIKLGMHTSNSYADGNTGGVNSISLGHDAIAEGDYSSALGTGVKAYSNLEIALGSYNTVYTPSGGVNTFVNDDRIFVIGNGTDDSNRSDALVIKKSGEISVENNQIKNIVDPTDAQDAATKGYVDNNTNSFSGSYNDLSDTPTMYTQAQVDAIIASLQIQIDGLKTLKDIDGNTYELINFGTQVWSLDNSALETYRDGTPIPQVTDNTQWADLTTGAWCYYNNDSTKGKLYNWYAIAGIHDNDENTPNKEFAPEGWHIPSENEWSTLVNYLIASGYNFDRSEQDNKIAKAMASKTGWNISTSTGSPGNNPSNNNSSDFNALPIGYRETNGVFFNEGNDVIFWSSSGNYSNSNASYRHLNKDNSSFNHWNYSMKMGYSVRFVKD
jgi:uncharacterized protein (TIGR02145 family)